MLKGVNIFGGGGGGGGGGGVGRKRSRNVNVSMKRLCRVGKAVELDDVLSLCMLEERIKDNSSKLQKQISEKLAEL